MSRYDAQLAPIAARISAEPGSVSVVLVPATEQGAIAEQLAGLLARPHLVLDPSAALPAVVDSIVTFGPGQPQRLLGELNGRRQWITDRGSLVLVLGRGELRLFQKYAGDVASITSILGPISYEPREPGDLALQRKQLAEHYRARFGNLDLRGFIRSEGEDASFALESIFQPLTGSSATTAAASLGAMKIGRSAPLTSFLESQEAPLLVLGGPGSGKSFLLRWYALRASAEVDFLDLSQPVPIHVSFAAYSLVPGLPSLHEYVIDTLLESKLSIVDSIDDDRLQSRLVFLLDGLDEAGDAAARARAVAAIAVLARSFLRARIVITSRQSGLSEIEIKADKISIDPLSPDAIRDLLVTWCGLYERHRGGTNDAERRGQAEGARLAAEVLASQSLHELASTPLLATIIAIVHRAGIRLPEHRAELYDHIIKVLVERWNQVRSNADHGGILLRTGDAVRLLGPVALEMINSDYEGAISEDELRSMLERSLSQGAVRGLTSSDEALETFRRSLGLLVERTPGVYGFLHQTLVEFLAAHELVRTGFLEHLCESPNLVFAPKWLEVILLSAGIIGQVQANDHRLEKIVLSIVERANHWSGRQWSGVPSLLAGLIVDDPCLTPQLVDALLMELIPKWLWDQQYTPLDNQAFIKRIARGPWRSALRTRLELAARTLDIRAFLETGVDAFGRVLDMLVDVNLEIAPLLCKAVRAALAQPLHPGSAPVWRISTIEQVENYAERIHERFRVTRGTARFLQEQTLMSLWWPTFWGHSSLVGSSSIGGFEILSVEESDEPFVSCTFSFEKHALNPATQQRSKSLSGSLMCAVLMFFPSHANPSMLPAIERIEALYGATSDSSSSSPGSPASSAAP